MGSKQKFIKWQQPMIRVLYALAPVVLASIWYFGWRALALLLVVNVAGFLSEYAFARHYREPVSSSVFVSNCLFALIIPPTLPLWMAAIGIIFGVVFGKMVFGGFGKNIFNPAMVGRAFIYINFALPMTAAWVAPTGGLLGGFGYFACDAVSSATPMQVMKSGQTMSIINLLFGNTSGCLGETCAAFIIIGGCYLLWTKTANKSIVFSGLIATLVLQGAFWMSGIVSPTLDPLRAILSGGFMLGLFFMATDPVSAAKTRQGRIIYGALIGILTVIIRTFSVWAEGFMFAILLANMFAPIIDHYVNELNQKKKQAKVV